ncbi:MAG: hypothetical protein Q8L75_09330 [Acidobacteriota bacterium]|nr:hypothetical protein [Acidobacteriota bacterium]
MRRLALLLVVVVLAPVSAGAQGLAGPFGGLFGRTPERTNKEFTAIQFRSSVGSQYDDVLVDDGIPAALAPQDGASGGINAGLNFDRRSDRLRLNAYGTGTYQQYFRAPAFGATSYDLGGLVVTKVATRLSLEGSGTYRRSPFYHLLPAASGALPLPDVLVPSNASANGARRLDNDTVEGIAGFSSPYTRRSTLSASVSRRATRFFNQPLNNFELWGAKGTWTRKMTRDVAARIGYGREEIQQSVAGGRFIHDVFDVGIDLAREISLARRTAFSFTTQTSMVRETGGERRYRLNGGINLTRAFQRTWAASVAATRNTEFLPGFLQPMFSDGVSGTVSGMLGDRVEWSAAVGASRGQIGYEAVDDFVTYTGNSRLSAGLTRHLGIFAQYHYYRYNLPPGSSSVVLLPQMSRQGVSVGLSAFVPIFTRERQPRDPR